jgi:hypothetical protein
LRVRQICAGDATGHHNAFVYIAEFRSHYLFGWTRTLG